MVNSRIYFLNYVSFSFVEYVFDITVFSAPNFNRFILFFKKIALLFKYLSPLVNTMFMVLVNKFRSFPVTGEDSKVLEISINI